MSPEVCWIDELSHLSEDEWEELLGAIMEAQDRFKYIHEHGLQLQRVDTARGTGYYVSADELEHFLRDVLPVVLTAEAKASSTLTLPKDSTIDYSKLTSDSVSNPKHYNQGRIEVIEFIEDQGLGFALGNCIKYIARAGKKDVSKVVEDLRKARWYLSRHIELLQAEMQGRAPVRPNEMNTRN